MDRPWFHMFSRDWIDNKELRRCSAGARSVLMDCMCLAHEGTPYGFLSDDVGPLTEQFLASRCMVSVRALRAFIVELKTAQRIVMDDKGMMHIPRMVRDEEIRLKRAAGGVLGGNPALTKGGKEGYPSSEPSDANRGYLVPDARTRAGADSEGVYGSNASSGKDLKNPLEKEETGDSFGEFRTWSEQCGMSCSSVEWANARKFEWQPLSWEQRLAAINGLKARKGTDDPAIKSLPGNYLKLRKWERAIVQPNGNGHGPQLAGYVKPRGVEIPAGARFAFEEEEKAE